MHQFRRIKFHKINMYFFFYNFRLSNNFSFLSNDFNFFVDNVAKHLLKQFKKLLNSSRSRISIDVFNICFVILAKFDCFFNIWASFLNCSELSYSTFCWANYIYLIFLYLSTCESELISTKTLIMSEFLLKITSFFLLKTIMLIGFIAFK